VFYSDDTYKKMCNVDQIFKQQKINLYAFRSEILFFLYSHPSSYFCLRISKFFYTPSLQNFKNELFANAYRIDIFLHYFHYPLRLDIRLWYTVTFNGLPIINIHSLRLSRLRAL